MQATYFNTTTSSTTPAPVISTAPIVIRKIMVGNPVTAGNLTLFNAGNVLSNNTTQVIAKLTYPSFSTTNINDGPDVYDFRSTSSQGGTTSDDGIMCGAGACLQMDQTMQVTVFWDLAEG